MAKALAGKALEAADYAAYAIVYGQGGSAAVAERASFEPEFFWQTGCLAALADAPSPAVVSETAAPAARSPDEARSRA